MIRILVLTLLFTFSFIVKADDTWVTDPDSAAWSNTEEVGPFLIDIGEPKMAANLNAALINEQNFYTHELIHYQDLIYFGRVSPELKEMKDPRYKLI